MPRGVKKENLPSKVCEVCKRPFTWRKVWERCWDDVKTCSDRCKAERKKQNKAKKDESNSVNTKETGPEEDQTLKMDNGTALVSSFARFREVLETALECRALAAQQDSNPFSCKLGSVLCLMAFLGSQVHSPQPSLQQSKTNPEGKEQLC